jgi:poly [ADP-ribose] polymerase 6/8
LTGYEELGVGLDVAAEVLRDPDVMDLMITMLFCACKAGRIELAFPDNVQFQTADGTEHRFMRRGEQNRELLSQVVDLIPSVDDMLALAQNGNLRVHLDSLHPLLYPLLRWLISSNRAHLRRLAPEEAVQGLGTSLQFVLLTGPVERESYFQHLKAETAKQKGEGSIFAFHGSAVGNWHSILRMGLKNYSNTKYMSAGAAYGAGVYFATHMSTSLGYCTRHGTSGWPRSRFGGGCMFMALCELINRPEEYTSNTGGIIVIPKEEYITTRYLLVNPSGEAYSLSLQINLVSTLRLGGPEAAQEAEARGKTKRKRGKWLGSRK